MRFIKKHLIYGINSLLNYLYHNSPKSIEEIFNELPNQSYQQHIGNYVEHGAVPFWGKDFCFSEFRNSVLNYIKLCNLGDIHTYKFSTSMKHPSLYSSVLACLTFSLFNELDNLSYEEKLAWRDYLDSYQNPEDGLFYDPLIKYNYDPERDWIGARHLAGHIVTAYCALGFTPKYSFSCVEKYYDENYMLAWLNSINWNSPFPNSDDIDNKIMNIGVLLQYSRDYLGQNKASKAIELLIDFLAEKVNPATGFWGNYNLNNKKDISRMVQFGYHLYSLFFYDNRIPNQRDMIMKHVLNTQNAFGGYSAFMNSSACEDIDSVDILCRLSPMDAHLNDDIKKSLLKTLPNIFANQNLDGGFVFRRDTPLNWYDSNLQAENNESSIFATWFRSLSVYYVIKRLNLCDNELTYELPNCPGYQFWK